MKLTVFNVVIKENPEDAALAAAQIIRRIGPDKGGHWEVIGKG